MNFGMAKNFFHLFSPSAKWCCPSAKGWCPSGKSIEFGFPHSSVFSFRKVHWVFFLSLELRSSFEKKNSMDFPSGHHPFASGQHHFASGENNCKKFFAIPQYPHPYIIFWQIKTPDFIFQLLSIISHPFGFILQQTPIQNYILHWSVKKKHSRESYITLEATHETRAKVKSGCPSNDIIKS